MKAGSSAEQFWLINDFAAANDSQHLDGRPNRTGAP
jgi:hypothetical protein